MPKVFKRPFQTSVLIDLPTSESDSGAKERILDAARRLFADQGFDAVSLRSLTHEAGVNLAAVHYHFGSKEGLIDSIIEGFANPVNQERLRLLDEAEATEGPVAIETIVDAFMRPILARVAECPVSERLFMKLMGRLIDERRHRLPQSVLPLFHEVARRFPQALARNIPHLSEEKILWRLHFTFGVVSHVLSHTDIMLQIHGDRVTLPPSEEILAMARTYCCAGLMAPA